MNNEKNIIEKTKEVKEIAKELKKIYEDNIVPYYLSMQNILSFLTLPRDTRFIQDFYINYAMLVNQKVTVPDLYFADSNKELKYIMWICQQIEEAKKILKEYQVIVGKIYRYMVDYLIIKDAKEQEEIKKSLADNRTKLKEIMENPIIDVICEVNSIIADAMGKFCAEAETEEDKRAGIGIYKSRDKAREYMEEVVDTIIKKFPEILQQDISQVDNEYWKYRDFIGNEFEDIERELWR